MHEQQPHNLEHRTFLVSVSDYQQLLERYDEATLTAAFVGRWASREAFGLELLQDVGAETRLRTLPGWLQPFVRLDGEAYSRDLERAGLYVVAPVESGVCVLDGPAAVPRVPT